MNAESRLTYRQMRPLPVSCLTCSKPIMHSKQVLQHIRKQAYISDANTGYFCSKKCSAKWKFCIRERRNKCVGCSKQIGWTLNQAKAICVDCKESKPAAIVKSCEHCNCSFKHYPKSKDQGRFCSIECYQQDSKRKVYSCQCCSKSFKVYGGGSSGLFCSRQCSGKYKSWASDRKARCKCGLATGDRNTKYCQQCRVRRRDQQIPKEFRKCINHAYLIMRRHNYAQSNPLLARCNSTATGLRLRVRQAPRVKTLKRAVPRNFDHKILMEMDRMKAKGKRADWTPLEAKCHSVASGLKKRGRRRRALN